MSANRYFYAQLEKEREEQRIDKLLKEIEDGLDEGQELDSFAIIRDLYQKESFARKTIERDLAEAKSKVAALQSQKNVLLPLSIFLFIVDIALAALVVFL